LTTTTQITNIAHLLDLTDYAGDFLADYDMDAVHEEYLDKINEGLEHGIVVLRNGDVIADVDLADEAREIDWKESLDGLSVDDIFERNTRKVRWITTSVRNDSGAWEVIATEDVDWLGHPVGLDELDKVVDVSVGDLGCEPGTLVKLALVDRGSHEIRTREVEAR
jgi:hypothetical protein